MTDEESLHPEHQLWRHLDDWGIPFRLPSGQVFATAGAADALGHKTVSLPLDQPVISSLKPEITIGGVERAAETSAVISSYPSALAMRPHPQKPLEEYVIEAAPLPFAWVRANKRKQDVYETAKAELKARLAGSSLSCLEAERHVHWSAGLASLNLSIPHSDTDAPVVLCIRPHWAAPLEPEIVRTLPQAEPLLSAEEYGRPGGSLFSGFIARQRIPGGLKPGLWALPDQDCVVGVPVQGFLHVIPSTGLHAIEGSYCRKAKGPGWVELVLHLDGAVPNMTITVLGHSWGEFDVDRAEALGRDLAARFDIPFDSNVGDIPYDA